MTNAKQNYEQFRRVFTAPNLIITSLLSQEMFDTLYEFMTASPGIRLVLEQQRNEDAPVRFRVDYAGVIKSKWLAALRSWVLEINKITGEQCFAWVEDTNGTDYYIDIDGDPTLAYNMLGTPKIAGKKNPNYEEEFPTKLRYYALAFMGNVPLSMENWTRLEYMTPTQATNQFNLCVEDLVFPEAFCSKVFYPGTTKYLQLLIKEEIAEAPKHYALALDWFYGPGDSNHHALFAKWVHGFVDTSLPESCFAHMNKDELIQIALSFVSDDAIESIVQDYFNSKDYVPQETGEQETDEESAPDSHPDNPEVVSYTKEDLQMLKTRRMQLVYKWKVSSDVVALLSDSESDRMWLQFENGEIHDD